MSLKMLFQETTFRSDEKKTCTKCNQEKVLDDFYDHRRGGKFGKSSRCKDCLRQLQIERERSYRQNSMDVPRKMGRPRKTYCEITEFDLSTDKDVAEAAYVGGFSTGEIADRLGMTRQGVDMIVIRAMKKLKENAIALGIEIDFDALERSHKND